MFYLFRLRPTTKPAAPNPINASVPGSGTAVMLPLVVDLSFLQLLGSPKVQSGLSASKEVDISNRSTAIIVFTITFPFIVGWQNIAATTRITSFLNVRFTLTKP